VTTGQLASDVVVVQRRTVSSLVVSQAFGGLGVATGIAVSALLWVVAPLAAGLTRTVRREIA